MFDEAIAMKYLNAIGKTATDTGSGCKVRITGVEFLSISEGEIRSPGDVAIFFHVKGFLGSAAIPLGYDEKSPEHGWLMAKSRGELEVSGALPWNRLSFEEQK